MKGDLLKTPGWVYFVHTAGRERQNQEQLLDSVDETRWKCNKQNRVGQQGYLTAPICKVYTAVLPSTITVDSMMHFKAKQPRTRAIGQREDYLHCTQLTWVPMLVSYIAP